MAKENITMKIFQHSEGLDQWERSNVRVRPMRAWIYLREEHETPGCCCHPRPLFASWHLKSQMPQMSSCLCRQSKRTSWKSSFEYINSLLGNAGCCLRVWGCLKPIFDTELMTSVSALMIAILGLNIVNSAHILPRILMWEVALTYVSIRHHPPTPLSLFFSIADKEDAEKAWQEMTSIEKYNGQERRHKNMSEDGKDWIHGLCNYDNCNDQFYTTTTINPKSTTKPTTKKPSSSSIASISLPLLMFTVLGSILILWFFLLKIKME